MKGVWVSDITDLDAEPPGTPLSGSRVEDFMNFGRIRDVRVVYYTPYCGFDMLAAERVLKMLVGLKEAGDLDIVGSEPVLDGTCKFDDRPKVLAMAEIIRRLLDEFDYELSPEFLEKIDGKSESLRRMQRKLLTGERRKQLAIRFGRSLTQIVGSRDAYALLPLLRHPELDELRSIAVSILS